MSTAGICRAAASRPARPCSRRWRANCAEEGNIELGGDAAAARHLSSTSGRRGAITSRCSSCAISGRTARRSPIAKSSRTGSSRSMLCRTMHAARHARAHRRSVRRRCGQRVVVTSAVPPERPRAIVRRGKVELRPDRHDAGRVHLALAAVIVPLDLLEADGLGDARHLIKIAQIIRQVRDIRRCAASCI